MSYKYSGGKLRRWEKLSREEQADLLFDLLNALAILNSLPEVALFLTDLLTSDEVKFISKRLRIAKLLLSDWKYRDIEEKLKVSQSTVAKVAMWLKEKGTGFRHVIEKLPRRRRFKLNEPSSVWEKYKGANVGAYWESLFGDANNGLAKLEKQELQGTLSDLLTKDVVRHRVDESYSEELKRKKRSGAEIV